MEGEKLDCSKLTDKEIRERAKDMNTIFDAAQKEKAKEEKMKIEEEIEEEIKTNKELFDHNVSVVVKRFKDDPGKLKEVMEFSQKIIDKDGAASQEKSHAMYEIRTFEEALKIIEGKQE